MSKPTSKIYIVSLSLLKYFSNTIKSYRICFFNYDISTIYYFSTSFYKLSFSSSSSSFYSLNYFYY